MLVNVGLPPLYSFYAVSAFVSFFPVHALIQGTGGRELEGTIG